MPGGPPADAGLTTGRCGSERLEERALAARRVDRPELTPSETGEGGWLHEIGPDEYQTAGRAGGVTRMGRDPATGRSWSVRGVGLAGEAALETYLACLGVRLPTRG